MSSDAVLNFNSVWMRSASDVYFAGNNGGLWHYDGSDIKALDFGSGFTINDIFGSLNGDLHTAVSLTRNSGTIMTNKGQGWESTSYSAIYYATNKPILFLPIITHKSNQAEVDK